MDATLPSVFTSRLWPVRLDVLICSSRPGTLDHSKYSTNGLQHQGNLEDTIFVLFRVSELNYQPSHISSTKWLRKKVEYSEIVTTSTAHHGESVNMMLHVILKYQLDTTCIDGLLHFPSRCWRRSIIPRFGWAKHLASESSRID